MRRRHCSARHETGALSRELLASKSVVFVAKRLAVSLKLEASLLLLLLEHF